MNKMLVCVFDSEKAAYEGLAALKDLHRDGDISLYGTAVIEKNADGELSTKQAAGDDATGTAIGMLSGSMIGMFAGPAGLLAGATVGSLAGLLADLRKSGIDLEFADEVAEALKPGKVAIVAEIEEGWTIPVDTRMQQLDGMVFRRLRSEIVEEQWDREVAATQAEMDELEQEIEQASDETKASIQKSMDNAKAKLEVAREQAEANLEQSKKEADEKLATLQSQIEDASDRSRSKIEKRMNEIKADNDARSEKLKATLAKIKDKLDS